MKEINKRNYIDMHLITLYGFTWIQGLGRRFGGVVCEKFWEEKLGIVVVVRDGGVGSVLDCI